jgi:hypothetical protein
MMVVFHSWVSDFHGPEYTPGHRLFGCDLRGKLRPHDAGGASPYHPHLFVGGLLFVLVAQQQQAHDLGQ